MCLPLMCVESEGRLTGSKFCAACVRKASQGGSTEAKERHRRGPGLTMHSRTCHQDLEYICTIGPAFRAECRRKCIHEWCAVR